jgi:hypothetical protein
MRKLMVSFALGLTLLALPGLVRADAVMLADLSGDQEVPPTGSAGTGFAFIYVPDELDYIYVYVEFSGLSTPATASHIHSGDAGVSGPIVLPFSGVPAATDGAFENYLTEDDFQPGGGLATWSDLILAIYYGDTYVNVHSRMFPGGEIRGQTYYYTGE